MDHHYLPFYGSLDFARLCIALLLDLAVPAVYHEALLEAVEVVAALELSWHIPKSTTGFR